MKTPEDGELKAKLQSWQIEARVPAGFQREVWQRIAARDQARHDVPWRRLVRWIAVDLARPQYATVLIVLGIAGSVTVAHLQAQEVNLRSRNEMQNRYVQSIDPMAQTASGTR